MKRLSAHTQPTNLNMCFNMSCPADVEGKCFSFVTNAVSLEGNIFQTHVLHLCYSIKLMTSTITNSMSIKVIIA